eukprot:TRINITY_DN13949_c0_g1_i2.p1 TRINITY_DN13949_c0_g1~~TRINITY_DN13949_c0_g1_i2.p1  ORF type:complete len:884 (+),score=217.54 TRINITY_DN13949_c0_g1_i2:79-2730(+)
MAGGGTAMVGTPPLSEDSLPIPWSFCCCITQEIMSDPVTTCDGHVYERAAIQEWFRRARRNGSGHRGVVKSPKTGMPLPSLVLTPNMPLKHAIEEYLRLRPCLERHALDHKSLERAAQDLEGELLAKEAEHQRHVYCLTEHIDVVLHRRIHAAEATAEQALYERDSAVEEVQRLREELVVRPSQPDPSAVLPGNGQSLCGPLLEGAEKAREACELWAANLSLSEEVERLASQVGHWQEAAQRSAEECERLASQVVAAETEKAAAHEAAGLAEERAQALLEKLAEMQLERQALEERIEAQAAEYSLALETESRLLATQEEAKARLEAALENAASVKSQFELYEQKTANEVACLQQALEREAAAAAEVVSGCQERTAEYQETLKELRCCEESVAALRATLEEEGREATAGRGREEELRRRVRLLEEREEADQRRFAALSRAEAASAKEVQRCTAEWQAAANQAKSLQQALETSERRLAACESEAEGERRTSDQERAAFALCEDSLATCESRLEAVQKQLYQGESASERLAAELREARGALGRSEREMEELRDRLCEEERFAEERSRAMASKVYQSAGVQASLATVSAGVQASLATVSAGIQAVPLEPERTCVGCNTDSCAPGEGHPSQPGCREDFGEPAVELPGRAQQQLLLLRKRLGRTDGKGQRLLQPGHAPSDAELPQCEPAAPCTPPRKIARQPDALTVTPVARPCDLFAATPPTAMRRCAWAAESVATVGIPTAGKSRGPLDACAAAPNDLLERLRGRRPLGGWRQFRQVLEPLVASATLMPVDWHRRIAFCDEGLKTHYQPAMLITLAGDYPELFAVSCEGVSLRHEFVKQHGFGCPLHADGDRRPASSKHRCSCALLACDALHREEAQDPPSAAVQRK